MRNLQSRASAGCGQIKNIIHNSLSVIYIYPELSISTNIKTLKIACTCDIIIFQFKFKGFYRLKENSLIKRDWSIFESNSSGNPQDDFEWFSYLLFCSRYNKKYGVFSYVNHASLESEPIESNGEIVGFQAKYYQNALTKNKDELLKTIEDAKARYPKLTKICFYTNQDWGQNTKSKDGDDRPDTLKQIEDVANKLNIDLEWNGDFFFRSDYVCCKNYNISKYFFSKDLSISKCINAIKRRAELNFSNISNSIDFFGRRIVLEAFDINYLPFNGNVLSICGESGSGKSLSLKKFYEKNSSNYPVLFFKSSYFGVRSINELFEHGYAEDILGFFEDSEQKTIVIDNAEKILDLSNKDVFIEFIQLAISYKWKIVTTINIHLQHELTLFLEENIGNLELENRFIPMISSEFLDKLSEDHNFLLPQDSKLKSSIRNPFYLKEYLKHYQSHENPEDYSLKHSNEKMKESFLNTIQDDKLLLLQELLIEKNDSKRIHLNINSNNSALVRSLVFDGVLAKDQGRYYIAHKIHEEWILESYLDKKHNDNLDAESFCNSICYSNSLGKAFRAWMLNKFTDSNELCDFVGDIWDSKCISDYWKLEALTSVILSEYARDFMQSYAHEIISENSNILKRIVYILRTKCKRMELLNIADNVTYKITKPNGDAWACFVDVIYDNRHYLNDSTIEFIIPVLSEWNSSLIENTSVKKSAIICLDYYEKNYSKLSHALRSELLSGISTGASQIKVELSDFIDNACSIEHISLGSSYSTFLHYVLCEITGYNVLTAIPNKISKMIYKYFLNHDNDEVIEEVIGINININCHNDMHDRMSFYTENTGYNPFEVLFNRDFNNSVDLVVNIVNFYTKNIYFQITHQKETSVNLNIKGNYRNIYISNDLWFLRSKYSIAPTLVELAIKGLEQALLKKGSDLPINKIYKILSKTNSCAIYSVISNFIKNNKGHYFEIEKLFFQVEEFFLYDIRMWFENPNEEKIHLENLIQYYQLSIHDTNTKDEIFEILNLHKINIDDFRKRSPNDFENWSYALIRMDSRVSKFKEIWKDGNLQVEFEAGFSQEQREKSKQAVEDSNLTFKYDCLFSWAKDIIRGKKHDHNDSEYNKDYKKALLEMKELEDIWDQDYQNKSQHLLSFHKPTEISCAILIRHQALSESDFDYCKEIFMRSFKQICLEGSSNYSNHEIESCFLSASVLFKKHDEVREDIMELLIARLINTEGSCDFTINTILDLQNEYPDHICHLLDCFIQVCKEENDYIIDEEWQSFIDSSLLINNIKGNTHFDNLRDCKNIQHIQNGYEFELNNETKALISVITPLSKEWGITVFKSMIESIKKELFSDKDNTIGFQNKLKLADKISLYMLNSSNVELKTFTPSIIDCINNSNFSVNLVRSFICKQKYEDHRDFWFIWEMIGKQVNGMSCLRSHKSNELIKALLFDQPLNNKEPIWKILNQNKARLIISTALKMAHSPVTIYAIAKLINTYGKIVYFNHGVDWLSSLLEKPNNPSDLKLDSSTIYHMRNYIEEYVNNNEHKIKNDIKTKNKILNILNFLIDKGDAASFQIRENLM